MDARIHPHLVGQANGNLNHATVNRIVGGVLLLIDVLALIGVLVKNNQLITAIASIALFISSLMFIKTLVTTGAAHCSVNTFRAWQRIASYASTPDTGSESEQWERLYFYEPFQPESPTPTRVERTRSTTVYCETSCPQADAEKRIALGVGILDVRSVD